MMVYWKPLMLAAVMTGIAMTQPASAANYERPTDYPPEMQAFLGANTPEQRERIDRWWSRMPSYFKESLMDAPFEEWREVIYCDYLGFRAGTPQGAECVKMRNESWQRNANQWNSDGSYRGPSEECIKRNNTDKFGRLVCVTEEERARVQEYWDSMSRAERLNTFSKPGLFWEAVQSCYEGKGHEVGTPAFERCADEHQMESVPMN